MKIFLPAAMFILLSIFPGFAISDGPLPKTGTFETIFRAHSPQSEIKTLAQRLKITGAATDYDLATHSFFIYVPEQYDPQKPPGLLVLINYKRTDQLPDPILPQLAKANMAFVVAKELPDAWWQRAGLALDAVSNVSQQYRIDRRRIYALGGAEQPDESNLPPQVALRLGLNYPDVFSGTLSVGVLSYRPVPAGNRGFWKAEMPAPDARFLAMARQRPLLFLYPSANDQIERFMKDYMEDGFRHVKFQNLTLEQFHYPNYTKDWLPDAIKFLDAATADLTVPATQPATRPAS